MAKPVIPTESEVQAQILDYLEARGFLVWRQNSGTFFGTNATTGHRWAVRSGIKGISDIMGATKDGRLLAIEVKRPGGRSRVRPEQEEFLARVRATGGVAILAYGIDDVINSLPT